MPLNSLIALEAVALTRSRSDRTQRRWQVLYEQMQRDHEPCFQTDQRHACAEFDCPWRAECMALRAEWRR